MLRAIDRGFRGLTTLLGVVLLAMVVLSVYNVISRYVFDSALLWADEVEVFAMIGIAYIGTVICAWRGVEIRMDILVQSLPPRLQLTILAGQQLALALLFLWIARLSYDYTYRAFSIGMKSNGAGIPIWIVHAFLPLSFVLMAAIAAMRLVCVIARRADPAAAMQPLGGADK